MPWPLRSKSDKQITLLWDDARNVRYQPCSATDRKAPWDLWSSTWLLVSASNDSARVSLKSHIAHKTGKHFLDLANTKIIDWPSYSSFSSVSQEKKIMYYKSSLNKRSKTSSKFCNFIVISMTFLIKISVGLKPGLCIIQKWTEKFQFSLNVNWFEPRQRTANLNLRK